MLSSCSNRVISRQRGTAKIELFARECREQGMRKGKREGGREKELRMIAPAKSHRDISRCNKIIYC